ncbi:MAG: T9SS type A sorting domain-containing protein, partial [Bacteroidota bacterium]
GGEIVLALNTTNRQNIMVNWTGRMLSSLVYVDSLPVTGQSNRFFNIKLQYSLDTALGYTDVPGDNAFWCNLNDTTYRSNGDSAVYSNMLPSDCENQGVVYLRWIYNSDGVGQGARPKLAVDDILVTSSLLTGMPVTKSNASWQAYPNPNNGELLQFSQTLPMLQIFSASGSKVAQASNTRSMSLQGLSPGLYLLVDQNGASRRLVIR